MLTKTALAIFTTATMAAAAPAHKLEGIPHTLPQPVDFTTTKAATGEIWTMQDLTRSCNKDDTACTWRYHVDTYKEGTDPYYCEYTVKARDGLPASKVDIVSSDGYKCHVFDITQGYDANGKFTVVVPWHPKTGRRIYAGYTDAEIANGKHPEDKSFKVENS